MVRSQHTYTIPHLQRRLFYCCQLMYTLPSVVLSTVVAAAYITLNEFSTLIVRTIVIEMKCEIAE